MCGVRCVRGRVDFAEDDSVSFVGKVDSADLGGSSNYSNENLEGRVKVKVS